MIAVWEADRTYVHPYNCTAHQGASFPPDWKLAGNPGTERVTTLTTEQRVSNPTTSFSPQPPSPQRRGADTATSTAGQLRYAPGVQAWRPSYDRHGKRYALT
jgi:hypothetical protein